MIFSVERAKLLDAVSRLQRSVGAKTAMPVLEGILISAEQGKITLVSYNLEMGMKKEMYASLEFPIIKEAVSENCSFSLGKELILNEEVHFDYLWCERELKRGKEALALYVAYRSPSFAGVRDLSASFNDIEKGRVASEMELYRIAEFSRAAIAIKKYMQETSGDSDIINENTVKTRMVRGRELLKKYLGEEACNYEF